jgi:hypothetical protein
MTHLSRCIVYLIVCGTLPANVHAQTTTVIPANEAAAHVGEYATVEGVVAKLFTSKAGNTFLNIGGRLPEPDVHRLDPPASPVSKSAALSEIEGLDQIRVYIAGWN